ncbi:MAG: hypothetical protein P8179_11625 [Candidatus Thiodiazotropha sp.]
MGTIRDILKQIELHDSIIESMTIQGDGSLELALEIDEIWNKEQNSTINGIRFKSVYEISDFKIDRLNVIGDIEVKDIEGYNKEFVIHAENEPEKVTMVSITLVAGGCLNIICSDLVELLQCHA